MSNVISLCEYRRRRRPTFTDQERTSAVIKAVTAHGEHLKADPLVIEEAVHTALVTKRKGCSPAYAIQCGYAVLRKRAQISKQGAKA